MKIFLPLFVVFSLSLAGCVEIPTTLNPKLQQSPAFTLTQEYMDCRQAALSDFLATEPVAEGATWREGTRWIVEQSDKGCTAQQDAYMAKLVESGLSREFAEKQANKRKKRADDEITAALIAFVNEEVMGEETEE